MPTGRRVFTVRAQAVYALNSLDAVKDRLEATSSACACVSRRRGRAALLALSAPYDRPGASSSSLPKRPARDALRSGTQLGRGALTWHHSTERKTKSWTKNHAVDSQGNVNNEITCENAKAPTTLVCAAVWLRTPWFGLKDSSGHLDPRAVRLACAAPAAVRREPSGARANHQTATASTERAHAQCSEAVRRWTHVQHVP
eukprot:5751577-Pleurochrysis_carterae.AAC.1